MMSRSQSATIKNPARAGRTPDPRELNEAGSENYERWVGCVDDARKLVAEQIVRSVRKKWGTAVALQAATGICQTEISRIRNGKVERFSLERLVWLLCVVDADVEVQLRIDIAPAHKNARPNC